MRFGRTFPIKPLIPKAVPAAPASTGLTAIGGAASSGGGISAPAIGSGG